jgi:endoglucanase
MTITAPLSVSGRFIVDASGNRVKLCGVNWAGAHQDQLTPGGLDYTPRQAIAEQLATWGFNSVRFPFAGPTVTSAGPVPPGLVSANPDLYGMTPWQVYQACVTALTQAGLMVIPNYHLLWCGWCCSTSDGNGLWYNDNHPSSEFTNNWLTVAAAFADNPLVIGFDLKNEPRPATIGGVVRTPSWGDGDAATDFRQMYSSTGVRIRAVAPGKLMFCEGLSYAGDLTKAGADPVAGPGVVYSAHDYSWFHAAGQDQAAYIAAMDKNSGYLMTQDRAPVWVGEFGGNNELPATFAGGGWFGSFAAWARARDVDWAWWCMDGTTRKGTTPQTNVQQCADGDRSGFGIFSQSWNGPSNRVLLERLQELMPATQGPGVA